MPGFSNGIVYADNVRFDGGHSPGEVVADGQLLIGSTVFPNIKVGVPTGSNGITVTPGSGTLAFSQSGNFVQQQIFYVGKHGNNANAGTNINTAVLTFGQALTLATTAVPSAVNRFSIVCLDDGIYTEDITCVSFVDINAQNAKLIGSIAAADDVNVRFRFQEVADATIGVLKVAGAGSFFVDIDEVNCLASGIWVINLSGIIQAKWKKCTIVDGAAIGDISSAQAHVHILGGDIYILGTGLGIARDNTGSTVGHVDHIIDQGAGTGTGIYLQNGTFDLTVDQTSGLGEVIHVDGGVANLYINEVSGTTAYNLTAGTLSLFYNSMAGVRTQTGGTLKPWTTPAVMTNGQLVIGSTGVDPSVAGLTPGPGISISSGAGSITVSSVGGGLAWSTKGASTALVNNNGFICTAGAALAFSLPAVSSVGAVVALTLDGSTSWSITQGAGQQIRFGASATAAGAGGSLTSTAVGDTVIMVCSVANTKWNVISSIGNITVA